MTQDSGVGTNKSDTPDPGDWKANQNIDRVTEEDKERLIHKVIIKLLISICLIYTLDSTKWPLQIIFNQ